MLAVPKYKHTWGVFWMYSILVSAFGFILALLTLYVLVFDASEKKNKRKKKWVFLIKPMQRFNLQYQHACSCSVLLYFYGARVHRFERPFVFLSSVPLVSEGHITYNDCSKYMFYRKVTWQFVEDVVLNFFFFMDRGVHQHSIQAWLESTLFHKSMLAQSL